MNLSAQTTPAPAFKVVANAQLTRVTISHFVGEMEVRSTIPWRAFVQRQNDFPGFYPDPRILS